MAPTTPTPPTPPVPPTPLVPAAPTFTIAASDTLCVGIVRDWAVAGMRALALKMQTTGTAPSTSDMKPFADAFTLANAMDAWRKANLTPGT